MNSACNIDLLRHGATVGGSRFYGKSDIPISRLGMSQMWTSTQKMSPHWDHIISSPLVRCADFAQALGQRYSIPVSFEERIKEINFGCWEGYTAAEIMETDADALTRFWENPLIHPPENGEYLLNFQARVLCAWNDITKAHTGKKVLLVTHSGVIRTILCHIATKSIESLLDFEVEHASMRRVLITQNQGLSRATLLTDP